MLQDKILVIGSSGQVASSLKEIANDNFNFVGRPDFDICDVSQLEKILKQNSYKLVVNCAAYTAVDQAEREQKDAYAVNSEAVKNLALLCNEKDISLIHISTDYVFDGKKRSPYLETDHTNPLSVYGKSKLLGESYIRQYMNKYIILRTSWIFSKYGTNFVKTMIKLANEKGELKVVSDQVGCPTSASNIAVVIMQIAQRILHMPGQVIYGTYHYSDIPAVSWYELACKIFLLMSEKYQLKTPTIKPIATSEYNSLATRPMSSVLDCSQINQNFNISQKDWRKALADCLENYLKV